ncbi:MAG: flagellar basal-body rod protein FlgF [Lachnospiraceae bacterium]|nr:flagellar basal-body rod protein FlgF [Lachnospiraceae bacterium]
MVKGLYTAYTGLMQQQNRLDVITNNLANADTTGYKKEGATTAAFDEVLAVKIKDGSEAYINRGIGHMSMGAKIGETYTDYSQGSFRITDNPYDIALDGDGFFSISFTNKQGVTSTKYTRDGSFTLTREGYLVTKDGDFVLGTNGPIQLNTLEETKIDELGNIYQNGALVDTLNIVDFTDYNYLSKYGENLYDLVEGGTMQAADCRVEQGVLEMSNMNIVSEMVDMIAITRNFESNQKIIQTIDTMLDKTVNQVGKL